MNLTFLPRHRLRGISLMEIIVVVAIIVVLAAIAYPVYSRMRAKSHKAQTVKIMANLGAAIGVYATNHNGELPAEDVGGKDDWAAAAQPAADTAWYNALPRAVQKQGVGDFVKAGRQEAFYSDESMLFVPGAHYSNRKLARPFFAIGYNSRLHRKAKDGTKTATKLNQVPQMSRTVALFERRLSGETRAHGTMSKKDYDGTPKGTAKAFVARYAGVGVLVFLDGHAKEVTVKDLLQPNGDMIWSPDDSSIILWSPDPAEDPNISQDQ